MVTRHVVDVVTENERGPVTSSLAVVGTDDHAELDVAAGLHYCDNATAMLAAAASVYEDLSKTRIATIQRSLRVVPLESSVEFFGDDLDRIVARAGRQVTRLLRKHPVWPWLSQYPGLGGVHTARLIGYLRDPARFSGAGKVMAYCGLHVVDGRSPRQRKGVQGNWHPGAKGCVLMPSGIADQIVRLRVPVYRDIYDWQHTRLFEQRGSVDSSEVDGQVASAGTAGLRPFQIDALARKIAAKEFVKDLWRAWGETA